MKTTQLILNIHDQSKAQVLLEFLKSLNYISLQEVSEENVFISQEDKDLMITRKKNAKPKDFKDWDELRKKFNLK